MTTTDRLVWRLVRGCRCFLVAALALVIGAASARAQTPEPCPCPEEPAGPPPLWTGSIGAGVSATTGNTDTSTYNLGFELTRDPQTRTVFETDGLLLRGSKDGEDTVDRLTLNGRVEYTLNERTYAFGQFGYLRDQFKEIDYFLAPLVGVGYKLLDTDRTALDVDGGLGAIWEKNPGLDVRTDASVGAGEKLTYKLTDTASITRTVPRRFGRSTILVMRCIPLVLASRPA
ncbi:MAG: DUF481 domain-containing protein [Luteitalea sp.]|nr:DUF481 domain-containing protein [Luteitalea sp.]